MNEYEAKELLKKYGIKVPKNFVMREEEDLKAMDLKYPLVAKVLSDEILHKSDVGGVILGIKNDDELRDAFKRLNSKFKTPVLVEEMESGGVEIIVGVINDATFGHSIMFGLGGIFTEILKDVSFRVIPITKMDAEEMLNEIKGKRILEGYRGIRVSRENIIELLLNVSRMVEDMGNNIEGMDLNPVLAREDDCIVLDAKIITKI